MAAPTPTVERLLLTVPAACEALSISRTHLYRLHRLGYFEFVRLGGSARVRVADLHRLAGVEL